MHRIWQAIENNCHHSTRYFCRILDLENAENECPPCKISPIEEAEPYGPWRVLRVMFPAWRELSATKMPSQIMMVATARVCTSSQHDFRAEAAGVKKYCIRIYKMYTLCSDVDNNACHLYTMRTFVYTSSVNNVYRRCLFTSFCIQS